MNQEGMVIICSVGVFVVMVVGFGILLLRDYDESRRHITEEIAEFKRREREQSVKHDVPPKNL